MIYVSIGEILKKMTSTNITTKVSSLVTAEALIALSNEIVVGSLASGKVGNTKDAIMTGSPVVEQVSSNVTSSSVDDATGGTKVGIKKARRNYPLRPSMNDDEINKLRADRQNARAGAKKRNLENARKLREKKIIKLEDDIATMIKLKAKVLELESNAVEEIDLEANNKKAVAELKKKLEESVNEDRKTEEIVAELKK